MESLSVKEFFDHLQSDTLKPSFAIKGIVKKSTRENEVLFAKKGDLSHWIGINASSISNVMVIKSFVKEGETYTVVKIHFHKPSTPEGKMMYELLQLMAKEEQEGKCGKGKCICPHCGCKGNCSGQDHCHCHHCQCGDKHFGPSHNGSCGLPFMREHCTDEHCQK